jgi:hypothetical protein
MDESDPHIHVGANLNADAMSRDQVASVFGLAADLPSVVTTGCGARVARAMTSPLPERVTCLPCREHASRHHLRCAEMFERFTPTPGVNISSDQARQAAEWHRDRATKFAAT